MRFPSFAMHKLIIINCGFSVNMIDSIWLPWIEGSFQNLIIIKATTKPQYFLYLLLR